MNKQKGFSLIEGCVIIAIIVVFWSIWLSIKEDNNKEVALQQKIQPVSEVIDPLANDSKILYSRKFVIDFDQRMEKANKYILECSKTSSDNYKVLKMCTKNAYDAQGLANWDNNGRSLTIEVVEEYNMHKKNALNLLSTEI